MLNIRDKCQGTHYRLFILNSSFSIQCRLVSEVTLRQVQRPFSLVFVTVGR